MREPTLKEKASKMRKPIKHGISFLAQSTTIVSRVLWLPA